MAAQVVAQGSFTGADDITEITFADYTPVATGNVLVMVVDGRGTNNRAADWEIAPYNPANGQEEGTLSFGQGYDLAISADRNVKVFIGISWDDINFARLITSTPPDVGTSTYASVYEVASGLGSVYPIPFTNQISNAAPAIQSLTLEPWLGGLMPSYDKQGIYLAVAVEGLDDPVGSITFQSETPDNTIIGGTHILAVGERALNTNEDVSYEITSANGGGGLLVAQMVVPQSAYTEVASENFASSIGTIPAPQKGNLMVLGVRGTSLSLPNAPAGWTSEGFQTAGSGNHWVGVFWKEAEAGEDTSLSIPGATDMAYREIGGYLRAPRRRQIVKSTGPDIVGLDPIVTANNDAFIMSVGSPSDTADVWAALPSLELSTVPAGIITGGLGVDFWPFNTYPIFAGALGADDAQQSVTTDLAFIALTFDDDPNVPLDTDAPVAGDNSYTASFDTALVVDAPGVLANDTGNTLTVSAWGTPSHGTVVGNSDGSFIYTPEVGFSGADSFTYTVSNGDGQTDTGTVVVTVQNANQTSQTYLFPDEGQRLLYTPGVRRGSALTSARGTEVYVYEQAEGGSLADITDEDGDPIAGSLLVVDDDSLIPPFYGPLGVTTLWVEVAGSGVRQEVRASSADRLDKGDGGNGGAVDARPHEMLPLTVSRHTPFTAWTQNGRSLTAAPQPSLGATVMFSDASLPIELGATPGSNGWLQAPKQGDPLRLSLVAIHIGPDPDVAAEAHITLTWQPFDIQTQQPVGPEIQTNEIIPLIGMTEYTALLVQGVTFEDMPVGGVELTIPEYPPGTNLMLAGASMHTQEAGTGDPITGLCLSLTFSMYQGTESLIPRLATDINLVSGMVFPHFPSLTIDPGAFYGGTKSMEVNGYSIVFRDHGFDPDQEVSLTSDHEAVPGSLTLLVNGEIRGSNAPSTPESFARLVDLPDSLTAGYRIDQTDLGNRTISVRKSRVIPAATGGLWDDAGSTPISFTPGDPEGVARVTEGNWPTGQLVAPRVAHIASASDAAHQGWWEVFAVQADPIAINGTYLGVDDFADPKPNVGDIYFQRVVELNGRWVDDSMFGGTPILAGKPWHLRITSQDGMGANSSPLLVDGVDVEMDGLNSAHWNGDPTTAQEAINRMAALLYTLNSNTPIP